MFADSDCLLMLDGWFLLRYCGLLLLFGCMLVFLFCGGWVFVVCLALVLLVLVRVDCLLFWFCLVCDVGDLVCFAGCCLRLS